MSSARPSIDDEVVLGLLDAGGERTPGLALETGPAGPARQSL
ncbi:MAG: hypothetical protein ACRDN9_04870 [Streptosporangiaceae bacterium]